MSDQNASGAPVRPGPAPDATDVPGTARQQPPHTAATGLHHPAVPGTRRALYEATIALDEA